MPKWRKGDPHLINPNPDVLEGIAAIATYLGRSYNCVNSWIIKEGLPAAKTANGTWITTKQAIMAWILQGIENSPLPQDPLIHALLIRTIQRVHTTSLEGPEKDHHPICPYTGEVLQDQTDRMDTLTLIGTGAVSRSF